MRANRGEHSIDQPEGGEALDQPSRGEAPKKEFNTDNDWKMKITCLF